MSVSSQEDRSHNWFRGSEHSPNLPSWDTLAFSGSLPRPRQWANGTLKGRGEGSGVGEQEGLKAVPEAVS